MKIDSNAQKSRAIFFRRCMLKRFAKQATKANEVSIKTKKAIGIFYNSSQNLELTSTSQVFQKKN